MEIAIVYSRAQTGIHSPQVSIEVHLSRGLPSFSMVGLPETAVRESRDRVRSAILSNHFEFPLSRITVNLAPADLPKEGARFDLPIAIGILLASGQLPGVDIAEIEFIGELALTGELRPVRGVLPAASAALGSNRKLVLPLANTEEACLIKDLEVIPAGHLLEVCAHLTATDIIPCHQRRDPVPAGGEAAPDLCEVNGQHLARRALEIAAAGQHNLLMLGPPGTGKTMLAERLPGILPGMSDAEAMETAAVASISHTGFDIARWKQRPFRAPHHTASAIAMVGGGSRPRPGEISLAHNGVLFLDELPEFGRRVLEVLREPMEAGRISISRAAGQLEFPANFQLLAAMNPCPCGYLGDPSGKCRCNDEAIRRYHGKISGPLLDRIDMHIEVPRAQGGFLGTGESTQNEASASVRLRTCRAFARQLARGGKANSRLKAEEVFHYCQLGSTELELLEQAIAKLGLSARASHRILRVARTIADLADAEKIHKQHLAEAISFRKLDKASFISRQAALPPVPA